MGSRFSQVSLKDPHKKKFSHFSEHDLKKWETQFNFLFPLGYLTEKDLIIQLTKLFPFGKTNFIKILFKTINISNTGEIDFSELLIAFSILTKGSIHEKLRWIFRLYDLDCDGVISKDEMKIVINSFYEMVNNQNDVDSFVNKIFKECKNKSGFLTYDDFKILAQKRSEVLEIFELL